MQRQPTVAVFPEPGAWGPTNNLVAIADHLREHGIRVVFLVEESFRGELEKRDFEESVLRITPPPEHEEQVGEGWAEFVRAIAPEFSKPTIEQLDTVTRLFWVELVAGAKYAHERLMAIWEDVQPDVIVSDNVTGFPAVPLAGVPWIRMVSANPLEMKDPNIPPIFSGYSATDRTGWDEFRSEFLRLHQPLMQELSEFNVSIGAPPLPAGEFQYDSPWLNLYLYPDEIDYARSQPLGSTWHRLGSTVRAGEAPFDVHEHLPGDASTIYLSLGSLGCNDLGLMQRLLDALDMTEYRVIVSMGPLADQMRLGERMYGDRFLPQPSILPQCDLLITHGGNNTLGEGFHFGLPMIVLPLFWDQYDNAQRLDEMGFGVRLASYDWDEGELASAIDRLLEDDRLRRRMRMIASRLQANPGGARGADLIERVLRTGRPVTA